MAEPPDRLAELRRQRALACEQLAWLDREIAAAERAAGVSSPPSPSPAPAVPPTADPAHPLYAPDPAAAHADGRRGCFLYTAAALLFLFALLAAIYFLRYRDRSLLFVEHPAAPPPPANRASPPSKK